MRRFIAGRKPPSPIESIYERALVIELEARAIAHTRQLDVPVRHRGVVVGTHRLDLLVEAHFAVVRSQLCASDCRHGLILNFAKPTLEVRRVVALEFPRFR